MTTRHIIFDCDGVLVDSEPLSMRADVMLLRRHGIAITGAEAHARFVGKTFEAMLVEMTREHGVAFPPGLNAEKDRTLEQMYVTELQIVPGVCEVLETLRARGVSFSVASNSPRARVELALRLTGITALFERIVTFEDVARGKPAPDVFLRAVELSGFGASACLAIEDSMTGVTAAVAAGLRTLGFVGTHHAPHAHGLGLARLGAKHIFAAMQELPEFV